MPSPKKYEQQFFNALRDIFVGAKVEGDSGYVNLIRIKSRYYEKGVFPQLQRDIAEALKPFPDFREELFDKLYTFFQRYFSESGFIYFRHTLKLDEKKNAAHIQPQKIYPDIDLAETLSNLRGKWIKRVTAEEIEFQDGERISLKDLDWRLVKPLIWWS